jgi:hypothetical protein
VKKIEPKLEPLKTRTFREPIVIISFSLIHSIRVQKFKKEKRENSVLVCNRINKSGPLEPSFFIPIRGIGVLCACLFFISLQVLLYDLTNTHKHKEINHTQHSNLSCT